MEKVDFKKTLKQLYKPSAKEVSFVKVPAMQYLMIDGQGSPAGKDFKEAIETLYPIAYTLKFMSKEIDKDYAVPPLEALWWADDMNVFYTREKDQWKWTAMIMQPDWITNEVFLKVISKVKAKKSPPKIEQIKLETYNEGDCGQIMHIGPFDDEGPNIQRIHKAIAEKGGKLSGKHHEIYLSDFRRTAPEKLKTVIRQPFH